MFMLNNVPLNIGNAFQTADGTQYPANWLQLSTEEDRIAVGISEVPDNSVYYDDRFYWGVGIPKELNDRLEVKEDGSPLWVQIYDAETESMVDTDVQVVHKGLKSQVIAQIKQTAGSLLAPTDWKVIRAAETGATLDAETLAARAAIREASNMNEAAVIACATVDELAALQMTWPEAGNA